MTRFPLSKRIALVFTPVLACAVPLVICVDHTMDLMAWFMMTRLLPSSEIFICTSLSSGSVIGLSLLATHTVVQTGILLNHMARYQPGEVTLPYVFAVPSGSAGLKKPSANLPFLEMSFSPTASTCPATIVSFVAEHDGVCREMTRRRPRYL
ncbi:Os11g0208651 [Oryza sativa Japonica Group]|uniref:Os11g0208651 protein n=1 Tax=Oryza sativa subsp. japonica TaxID=39947 RepID=A0A0P0Y0H0_ORYSJ|nr:hypothetical protein EE612_054131 [Oryza sativa]BAT13149.1 Os11g0208651 [Oryza sativa Japonica Group]